MYVHLASKFFPFVQSISPSGYLDVVVAIAADRSRWHWRFLPLFEHIDET